MTVLYRYECFAALKTCWCSVPDDDPSMPLQPLHKRALCEPAFHWPAALRVAVNLSNGKPQSPANVRDATPLLMGRGESALPGDGS